MLNDPVNVAGKAYFSFLNPSAVVLDTTENPPTGGLPVDSIPEPERIQFLLKAVFGWVFDSGIHLEGQVKVVKHILCKAEIGWGCQLRYSHLIGLLSWDPILECRMWDPLLTKLYEQPYFKTEQDLIRMLGKINELKSIWSQLTPEQAWSFLCDQIPLDLEDCRYEYK